MRKQDTPPELIKEWYNELLGSKSLNKLALEYHTTKETIKKRILEQNYDYSLIVKKREEKISKSIIDNAENYYKEKLEQYSETELKQLYTDLQNEYYEIVCDKYPILQQHRRSWPKYFAKKGIKIKRMTTSQRNLYANKKIYNKWETENKQKIIEYLKQNKSLTEISDLLFEGKKRTYLNKFIQNNNIIYNNFLDQKYRYELIYGKEAVSEQIKIHGQCLNHAFFQQTTAKIAKSAKKNHQQKKISYDDYINEEQLKKDIIEQYLTAQYFKRKYKDTKYLKYYRTFFEKYPAYCLFKGKRNCQKIFENIKKEKFCYNSQLRYCLDQVAKKYPELIQDWPTILPINNIYYAFLMNRIYYYNSPVKYLNYLLQVYNKPIFSYPDLITVFGQGGYLTDIYSTKQLTKTNKYKILHSYYKLRRRYWNFFNGTDDQFWKEMELLQTNNIKSSWFAKKHWRSWRYLIYNKLKLHCTNIGTVEKLIYALYQDKFKRTLHLSTTFSGAEQKIASWLELNQINYYFHNRKVLNNHHELDFTFEKQKIAIEVNPTYTHNSSNNTEIPSKDKYYHWNKYKECQEKGITLISLFEKDIVEPTWSNFTKPFLLFKLKKAEHIYYARQVKLIDISHDNKQRHIAIQFIKKYHEQGIAPAKYYYGFYDQNNKLLGVCSWGKNHTYNKINQIELKRMVFLPNVQIKYALDKAVKHFFDDYTQYTELYSYSNNNIGNGNAYKYAGFHFVKETKPTLKYVSATDANDQYSWMVATPWGAKQGIIAHLIKPMHINNKEAEQIVINDLPHRTDEGKGYVPVYDTGNKLWKINRSDVIK